jgi:hypothetical protein
MSFSVRPYRRFPVQCAVTCVVVERHTHARLQYYETIVHEPAEIVL